MKRTLATLVTALAAATLISPTAASAEARTDECTHTIDARDDSIHATCTNPTDRKMTANLYVDCQSNWPDPHVQVPIEPNQTVGLSTICGGWSHPVGVGTYLS